MKMVMYWMSSRYLHSLVVGLVVLFAVVIPIADAGLSISGSIYQENVSAGSTVKHVMTVNLVNVNNGTDCEVEVMGLGNTLRGGTIGLNASDDVSPYTARPFITLDKTLLHLEPNMPQQVVATIKVPSNVGAGGRYALINFRTIPKEKQQVTIVTAVNVPIAITIANSKIIKTGEVTSVAFIEGQPAVIQTTLKNTGNHHYNGAVDVIKIVDSRGNLISTLQSHPSDAILPMQSIQYSVPITLELPPDNYTVVSDVVLDNRTLDKRSTTFEIAKQYVPPFQPVNRTVTPQNGGMLNTTGDKISINFPAGAVLDSTQVNLKPVITSELPSAPQDVSFTGISFVVEGITGLLSKDATITVKYGRDELDAAAGDVSKLFLARYDKIEKKWTLMPTSIDRTAGTLTTTTNRLSTWAVVVSSGPAPGVTKVPGFTAVIALGALAMMLLVTFRKKAR